MTPPLAINTQLRNAKPGEVVEVPFNRNLQIAVLLRMKAWGVRVVTEKTNHCTLRICRLR
jgi:hypothetical protein